MIINNKDNFYKYLFFYRSFIFKFTKFNTNIKDKELELVISALNIKRRRKRIFFVIDKLCDQIDDYYKKQNICDFHNNRCICHRKQKLNYINGCCRKCIYQTDKGCPTKNFACKMFSCSYVKNNYKTIQYNDLILLKVLTPLQRMILKRDYFSTIEEVTNDLFFGPIYSITRMIARTTKVLLIRPNLYKK